MANNKNDYFTTYLKDLHNALSTMIATDEENTELTQEQAVLNWCHLCHDVKTNHKTMYFIGNGASASMASHMAADFSKNCDCRALTFNDIALMTAVSNDIHYEDCFAVPLSRFATNNDLLIAISSSGNSPNIIKAIKQAKALQMQIVTVSGMKQDNQSRTMGDLNFWIPASTYGLVEASHQAILHCWLDTFLEIYGR